MGQSYRELLAWQKAMRLVTRVYAIIPSVLPRTQELRTDNRERLTADSRQLRAL